MNVIRKTRFRTDNGNINTKCFSGFTFNRNAHTQIFERQGYVQDKTHINYITKNVQTRPVQTLLLHAKVRTQIINHFELHQQGIRHIILSFMLSKLIIKSLPCSNQHQGIILKNEQVDVNKILRTTLSINFERNIYGKIANLFYLRILLFEI